MPDEGRATQLSLAFLGGAKQGMSENTRSGDGANLTIGQALESAPFGSSQPRSDQIGFYAS